MYGCSGCIQFQVYCAKILVPVSYIPLQETMKILDLMQDGKETALRHKKMQINSACGDREKRQNAIWEPPGYLLTMS